MSAAWSICVGKYGTKVLGAENSRIFVDHLFGMLNATSDSIGKAVGKIARECHICVRPQARLRCGKCQLVRYCGTECQRADWAAHKPTCKRYCREKKLWMTDQCIFL